MDTSNELAKINGDIQSLNRALFQTPDDYPIMPLLLACLGKAHDEKFDLLNELDDLEKAIKYRTTTLTLTPDSDPGLSGLLCDLVVVHGKRFQRLGDLDDIEKAIEYGHISVELALDDDPAMPARFANLGTSHRIRFESVSELPDLEDAIQYTSRAVALTPGDHPSLPGILTNLGVSHRIRFKHLGGRHDIEKAIEYETRALALAPDGHPHLPDVLESLGTTHGDRFKHLGELKDLEHVIEYQSRALDLTPDGHPDLPSRLTALGASYSDRFERLGELDDLEHAIKYDSRAIALALDGHPNLPPGRLANLGASHSARFELLGELSDLENAIEYESRALALTPDEHPNLPSILASLGMSHSDRFERLGELSDVENAIEYGTRAVALTPNGYPRLPERLASLGVSHIGRLKRLDELSDLKTAIKYQSQALALTPDGHPDLSNRLAHLGTSLSDRFQRLGELSDLEHAIKYEAQAIVLTPDGNRHLPGRLANLGTSYSRRFEHLGELSDLECAIKYECQALALAPNESSYLPGILMNLAASHRTRFQQLGEMCDIEHAMNYQSRALALTSEDHPDTSRWHFNHALSYFHYFQQTTDPSHLRHSLAFFRSASQLLSGAPRDRFRNAQTWANTAFMHNPDNCIEAYQTAMDLLHQFIWLGATTDQRYQDLSMTEVLAVEAASAAIRLSNHSLALEWLEHARCVVWNQSLMLRSPLDKLHSVDPNLGAQLQAVANQLHNAGSYSHESRALASRSITPEQVGQEHRRLAKQYEDLLVQIRQLPGFDDFLRPMKAKALVQAARTGPMVVITCYENNCDALLILPGQDSVGHVPLPGFSAHKTQQARETLESSLRCKGIRERGVKVREEPGQKDRMLSMLATLWHDVVKPILDHLGYINNSSADKLPHITWCPTGALSFLPLHAAGDYGQGGSRVFDHVISSYTPTLTALLASGSNTTNSTSSCRILAIGQANTPKHSALPGATKELACIQAHTPGDVHYSQLMDSQATVSAVLDAMEQHDWVHLACHAHQNASEPTKSGFFLHDGTLDLETINRRSFKGKGLAFLSACQTAMGDERLADEAVHLASGMLMAGYSSVIATMWSVHDEDAPLVADKVYAQLMQDRKIGNGEAGIALHNALTALRELVGEQRFERWVPYIHIGS